jgi:glycerate 2-kinase
MSVQRLRKHARAIFDAALAAADPSRAVERHLARIDFSRFQNIYVLGAGKAGASMARASERVLKWDRPAGLSVPAGTGLLNVKYGHTTSLRRIELNECGHPEPDERGMNGAERIAALAAQAQRDDLVLCLISGGASALLPLPAPPVTLEEKRELTRLLLAAGADIHEMNAVRKHLSRIKGGELARLAAPARVESLLLSDVVGDNLDVIGSGLTAPDASTFADAAAVLKRYGIWRRAPKAVRARIESGLRLQIPETPKPGDAAFRRVRNTVIGSNRLALTAASARARELGYRTLILSSEIVGETREIARMHAAILREAAHTGHPVKPPACIISGGETTVTLKTGTLKTVTTQGGGLGGRNQEFALAAAIDLAGLPNAVVFSAGTDGTDGPTDAAGAIADGSTLARNPEARRYLDNHDSYRYFESIGDLVKTGPTHTNVMDVRIMLLGVPQ